MMTHSQHKGIGLLSALLPVLFFGFIGAGMPARAESRAWLVVLLEYPDRDLSLPPKSHFETLFGTGSYPGLGHFINEVSYRKEDLLGSQVKGPFTLPREYDGYNFDNPEVDDCPDGPELPRVQLDTLLPDVVSELGDNGTDISGFYGLFLIMNGDPAFCGGLASFITGHEIDGQGYAVAVFGPTHGWNKHEVLGHELLHSYGIMHSSYHAGEQPHPYTARPNWDLMGGGSTCVSPNPDFGCMSIHTIAWHKERAGWIEPARVFDAGAEGPKTVIIERLERPPMQPGSYLMAKLPVPGSKRFYTIEYRRRLSYDEAGSIPGDAVIIHEVDPERKDDFGNPDFFAWIVDADGNGDPNDGGAMWLPKEGFQKGHVVVYVESMTEEHAVVSLANSPQAAVYCDAAYTGEERGTISKPWNTLREAHSNLFPGAAIYMRPGSYGESLTISKPTRLKRLGSQGVVVLGE